MRNFYWYLLSLDTAADTAVLLEYTWLPLCLCQASTFRSYKYVGTPASLSIVAFLSCIFCISVAMSDYMSFFWQVIHDQVCSGKARIRFTAFGGGGGEQEAIRVLPLSHTCMITEIDLLEVFKQI